MCSFPKKLNIILIDIHRLSDSVGHFGGHRLVFLAASQVRNLAFVVFLMWEKTRVKNFFKVLCSMPFSALFLTGLGVCAAVLTPFNGSRPSPISRRTACFFGSR